MELISIGLRNAFNLVVKRPKDLIMFLVVAMVVAFLGFLPVLLLNKSWLDPLQYVKTFYGTASQEVVKGKDLWLSLNVANLGPAGFWVFGSLLWKYIVTIPFQIALFLPIATGRTFTQSISGLKNLPALMIIQLVTGLSIVATALTGVLITIAVFAGAASPFFMIIVLLVVLSLVVVLTLSPFGLVLGRMTLFKSIGFSFNNSLKYGWSIFVTLLITSVVTSMLNSWTGNIGLASDCFALLLFIPQYCILHSIYERMVQDASKASANI